MCNDQENNEPRLTPFANRVARGILDLLQKHGRTVTYGEVASEIGLNPRGCRCMSIPAGNVSAFCMRHGFPPLTAIMQNARTNLPGPGFDLMFNNNIPWHEFSEQMTEENREEVIRRLQEMVLNTDNWNDLF